MGMWARLAEVTVGLSAFDARGRTARTRTSCWRADRSDSARLAHPEPAAEAYLRLIDRHTTGVHAGHAVGFAGQIKYLRIGGSNMSPLCLSDDGVRVRRSALPRCARRARDGDEVPGEVEALRQRSRQLLGVRLATLAPERLDVGAAGRGEEHGRCRVRRRSPARRPRPRARRRSVRRCSRRCTCRRRWRPAWGQQLDAASSSVVAPVRADDRRRAPSRSARSPGARDWRRRSGCSCCAASGRSSRTSCRRSHDASLEPVEPTVRLGDDLPRTDDDDRRRGGRRTSPRTARSAPCGAGTG